MVIVMEQRQFLAMLESFVKAALEEGRKQGRREVIQLPKPNPPKASQAMRVVKRTGHDFPKQEIIFKRKPIFDFELVDSQGFVVPETEAQMKTRLRAQDSAAWRREVTQAFQEAYGDNNHVYKSLPA